MAIDPVCGMTVDPRSAAGSATHDGKTYWFCSAHCLAAFEANPAKGARGTQGTKSGTLPSMRIGRPWVAGSVASAALLAFYLGVLTAVSGWDFTLDQLATYWYFIVALAAGFGLQVGLYVQLKHVVGRAASQKVVVATSGTTSTAAMVSCCTHYLANILPILGASGFVALVAQYQTELFWVGLAMNAAGTAFVAAKLVTATREHARCAIVS